ncbi:MAG: hypothetical protein ACOZBL_01885 [Patescibacteria group bacterium]
MSNAVTIAFTLKVSQGFSLVSQSLCLPSLNVIIFPFSSDGLKYLPAQRHAICAANSSYKSSITVQSVFRNCIF